MSILERVYKIERILKEGRAVSMRELQEALEASRATIKRDLDYLRDRLNAPVVWDRRLRGYRLEGPHSLPSLYLSQTEMQALLVLHHLIARVQPTIAHTELEAVRALLPRFTGCGVQTAEVLAKRVRILSVGARPVNVQIFETVTAGVLGRRRLQILYRSRSRGEDSSRAISPARLVHYRDNWYLDAWCHLRTALRSFAVDAILSAKATDEIAHEVPDEELDRHLGGGYGIFAGSCIQSALLRFSVRAARWVATETWHTDQIGHLEPEGTYLLRVPFSQFPELVRDILRYGPDVQVIEPAGLIDVVRESLRAALQQYS